MIRHRGFTMIELLLTVAVLAVVAGISFSVLQVPYAAYVEQRIHTALTNRAGMAMAQFGRDVRNSLPNSVRSSGSAIELLDVNAVARYRAEGPADEPERLRAGIVDGSFNTLTNLGVAGVSAGEYLAVYPLGLGVSDPWSGASLSPQLTSLSVSATGPPGPAGYDNEFRITFAPVHAFPLHSPARRIYRVSGPVSYVCEGDRMLRYSGYSVGAVQPVVAADFAPVTGVVVATGVTDCAFRYSTVNARYGLVTSDLELSEYGESVRITWQAQVENTP